MPFAKINRWRGRSWGGDKWPNLQILQVIPMQCIIGLLHQIITYRPYQYIYYSWARFFLTHKVALNLRYVDASRSPNEQKLFQNDCRPVICSFKNLRHNYDMLLFLNLTSKTWLAYSTFGPPVFLTDMCTQCTCTILVRNTCMINENIFIMIIPCFVYELCT